MGTYLHGRVRHRAVLFGVGLVGALSLFAAALLLHGHASSRLSTSAHGLGELQRDPPLAGGVPVSLAQAQTMTGVAALLPQTSLASNSSINGVWARSDPADMLVMYQSGVGVEVRPWSIAQTPDEHWSALMSEGLPGSIVTVNGQDMYVMTAGGQGGSGSVNFVTAAGTWVTVYGDGTYSDSQLQSIATSAYAQVGSPSLP